MKRILCVAMLFGAVLFILPQQTQAQQVNPYICLNSDSTLPSQTMIAACDQLVRLTPSDARAWYRRGTWLQDLGRSSDAIESFDTALRLNPQMTEALGDRGVEHARSGNLAQALADLSAVIRMRPSTYDYYNRGTVYSALSNYQAAIADFNEVLRLDPRVHLANLERGIAYSALRQHREAVLDLRVAVQREPSTRAWTSLCWNLAATAEFTEALRACEVAGQLDATRQPFNTRGFINLRLRRYQLAHDDYEAALLRDPAGNAVGHYGRGLARLALGRVADAQSDFEAALAIDPTIAAWFALYDLSINASVPVASPIVQTQSPSPENSQQLVQHADSPRIALVIGVSTYETMGNLANPANDARAMAATLRSIGFDVDLVIDPDLRVLGQAISRLGGRMNSAGPNATGLFFFAGHGIQSRGVNYLIPSRPQIRREADLAVEAVTADAVLQQMQEANVSVSILILDACRDMPLARSFRNNVRGLAGMRAPQGVFIAYSTAPGDVAADGEGMQNSPFTSALVSEIPRPGRSIADTFIAVRRAVIAATRGDQTPWEASSMVQQFYFVSPPESTARRPQ